MTKALRMTVKDTFPNCPVANIAVAGLFPGGVEFSTAEKMGRTQALSRPLIPVKTLPQFGLNYHYKQNFAKEHGPVGSILAARVTGAELGYKNSKQMQPGRAPFSLLEEGARPWA